MDFGGYLFCFGEEDLIGFVIMGVFSFSEGRGMVIGLILVGRVFEMLREMGFWEGKFCVVRNVGESIGWLVRWEVV